MSEPICQIAYGGNPDDCECPDCREHQHELDRLDEEMGRRN